MKINANSIRQGTVLEHNGRLYIVTKQPDHTQPGKGGAYVQVEMKDIKVGTKLNERFSSSESVEKVRLEEKRYQFLYFEDEKLTLMDNETFEQILITKDILGDQLPYVQDGMEITCETHNDEVINAYVPEKITAVIAQTEPVIKGQTVTSSFKPAILDNGVRVMVPPFINIDDKVIIRTTDSTYIERAK
ncbi:MAG: elongation factor P [Rickettsiales bacterium]